MKRNKLVMIATSMLVLFLVGCNVETQEADIEETIEKGGAYSEEVTLSKESSDSNSTVEIPAEKSNSEEKMKILSTNNIIAETLSVDEDLAFVVAKVHEYDGYISFKDVKEQEAANKDLMEAKVTLRVPKERLNEITKDIKDQLSITSELVNSVDVTDEYYDIETRIENLEERESRLRELYDSSDNIKEIIEIDDKLFEVTQEKEETIQKRVKMSDRISFSRVDIEIKEVNKLSIIKDENLTTKEKIAESLSATGEIIKSSVIWIVLGLIKIVPVIVLAVIGFKLFKILKRKYDKFTSTSEENK